MVSQHASSSEVVTHYTVKKCLLLFQPKGHLNFQRFVSWYRMKDCVPLGQVQASAGSALVGSPGWPSFLLTFSYSCPKPCPSALFSHDLTGHQPSLLDILVLAPMTVCPPTASWAALGSFDSSPAVPGAASPPSLSLIVVPFQNSSRRLSTEPHTGIPPAAPQAPQRPHLEEAPNPNLLSPP